MRRLLAAALVSAIAVPAAAQSIDIPSGTYTNDRTHTAVVWKLNHIGFSTYTGMFDRAGIAATVELDADDVSQSSLTVDMSEVAIVTAHPIEHDPRSIDFDEEIASPMFLDSASKPISFTSTAIEVTGDNTADITGDLTLNGQTHPVVLKATLNQAMVHPMAGVPAFGISATTTIDRTEWGIDALAGPVGTDVTLSIDAEFFQAQ